MNKADLIAKIAEEAELSKKSAEAALNAFVGAVEGALKKGEKYSVVLTMKRISVKDGSMVFTEVFPFSASFEKGLTVKGVINKGESFLFTDGKWNDMTETKDSLLERAYTQCADDLAANKGLPEITLDKSTVTVDNYPIKAILAAD